MGLPNINIIFRTQASDVIERSQKGTVGVILKDTADAGGHEITEASQIPAGLNAKNKGYIERAFVGYVSKPQKVLVYVLGTEAENFTDALDYMSRYQVDYLVGPPDMEDSGSTEIVTWVKEQRENHNMVKAVLPNKAADHEAIINFTTKAITVGETEYTTAEYCSRIAGLIAGTPLTISSTYAVLPEVTDVTRLTKTEMDTAIDNGEFILFHDGQKVKVGRGVNSLKTTADNKGEIYKKIKVVDTIDIIYRDIRMVGQDSYIGKAANTYDDKCLLIMAVKGYFEQLEQDSILQVGTSTVGIDMTAQRAYLKAHGVDVESMNEQQIKTASTGSEVLLAASIRILDAIEDITLDCLI